MKNNDDKNPAIDSGKPFGDPRHNQQNAELDNAVAHENRRIEIVGEFGLLSYALRDRQNKGKGASEEQDILCRGEEIHGRDSQRWKIPSRKIKN